MTAPVSARRRRWPWVVLGVAAAAGFLAGVGASLSMPIPTRGPTPTVSVQPAVGPGVLTELARAQRPGDLPGIAVGDRLVRRSFRLLDDGNLADLFVARDVDRHICLVAVTIDDQYAAACGPNPRGLAAPLLLRFTVTDPGGGNSTQVLASIDPATE